MIERELQQELKGRLSKEHKSVLRIAEKLREKTSQKLLKHVKGLQDKRSREKIQLSRYVSDALFTTKSTLDKLQQSFSKEMQAYLKQLQDKVAAGNDIFHRTEV
jgi:acetone carboxylase gamma subunit